MDRAELADFLRSRREALQPEDVGLGRGPRRRTSGLRREEAAALCGMSADYLTRLEQRRGPQPSAQMVAAIARGLRLTLDERDHLFLLAGHASPGGGLRSDHVAPALMRVLDRLDDTPAQVVNDMGEVLAQNRLAVALLGDETRFTGLAHNVVYRWFTDMAARRIYPETTHGWHGRVLVSKLRDAAARRRDERIDTIVTELRRLSPEFLELWNRHEIGLRHDQVKVIAHPHLGLIEVHCQTLLAADVPQALLVFTARPGTESCEKLRLLAVIGDQQLTV